ncbi:MAG: TrmB family transcriptional regulator [Candidatus Woesearchaeota archaeon]
MLIESLENLGLSKTEASIYLVLLENGPSLAGFLAKKTQTNRTTTYDALERLSKKDLITHYITSKRKVFKAKNPESLVKYYQDKVKDAEDLALSLNNMQREDKEEFEIFEGRKGINNILNDVLTCKEYVAYGSAGKFLDTMKHDFVAFQNKKKELKIKSRIIQPEINPQVKGVAYAQIRYILEKEPAPITTIIYNDKIAIITWSITPHAILIRSHHLSSQYKKHFEILWSKAKQ